MASVIKQDVFRLQVPDGKYKRKWISCVMKSVPIDHVQLMQMLKGEEKYSAIETFEELDFI